MADQNSETNKVRKINFRLIIIIGLLILVIAAISIVSWLSITRTPRLVFTPSSFSQLTDWSTTDSTQAFSAFLASCQRIMRANNEAILGTQSIPLQLSDLQPICSAAKQLHPINPITVREFFEQWFQPALISNHYDANGLFTGYYLPTIHASLERHGKFQHPIYGRPNDLVMVNLGLFRKELQGYSVAGKLEDGKLYPFNITRKQIDDGAVKKTAPVLVWADNKVDAFFMEIQGSGLALLNNGKKILLGYAARNNCTYTAIGKVLIAEKELTPEEVSMDSIRAWLANHPQQVNAVLQKNASYIFFQELAGQSPLGAQHVPLTPGHSLAVDNHFIPYGIPLWLQSEIPQVENVNNLVKFNRLLIAQDTGGAIRGPVRGDIYWGPGHAAEIIAGNMKSTGRYYALLPKTFVARWRKH